MEKKKEEEMEMEMERPGLGRRGVLQHAEGHAEGPLFCCFEEEAEVKTTNSSLVV